MFFIIVLNILFNSLINGFFFKFLIQTLHQEWDVNLCANIIGENSEKVK